MTKFSIAIHGGAGTIIKEEMTPELEAEYRNALKESLDAGFAVLENGGSAINAVKAAVVMMEDSVLFNAGRGSVFTKKGLNEMDAAIMDGRTLDAGAVAGVRNIRNPVELAEEVMLHSGHVFLSGKGANDFAIKQGIKLEPDEYFYSEYRYNQWKEIRDSDLYQLDHKIDKPAKLMKDKKFGTVGAVACDSAGNIAAATSTGGMTNKRYGRIGDSPMIGAGTYANNKTCAISCTGHGEIFIKAVAAYDVSCLMEYKNMTLQQACEEVVLKKLVALKGDGGLIGVDAKGNAAMVFNSAGMYRGFKNSDGENSIAIYAN
ncbi:isoaspartyl peptidase/L-asparaginase [Ginsengibacter hankyongi]|uniref:Isoaspartyl peptidase n=1 Tax=Ginsengibacter hankyongi TaxID=2607284 RepID=A0A5J5IJV6_9BACT|nr:isoaspartyl peptidase/L-asparaginase [Ginsengibacter hankyongi]KAA9039279.1 isoaspartyl peptidase/L-asparaginase [Ginsengibacter hankyongi]